MLKEIYVSVGDKLIFSDNGCETQTAVFGVFSSPSADRVKTELKNLPGTPDSGKICVVTASGSSFYMDKNGECVENSYEVGPIYATNLQSAFSSMFGKIKRDLTLESCLLYELDRDYSDSKPEDIIDSSLVRDLFKTIAGANGKLSDEITGRDYIAELTEFDESHKVFKDKLNSSELRTVAEYIMKIAEKNMLESAAQGAKVTCDIGADEKLKNDLAKTFTTKEIAMLEKWASGGEVSDELRDKALALAPKFKVKVSLFAKLFGKK